MPERTIDPAQLASYTAHLRREERSPGTIEKYLRDIRAFAGWLDGRPFPGNWLPNGGITCSLKTTPR